MTAFWILTSVVASVALGLAAVLLGSSAPWLWAAVGLCLPLPGVVWPIWFELGIRAWNKGVRVAAAAGRGYVLRVCYYLLFGAVGRAGSSLNLLLGPTEISRWVARVCHDPSVKDGGQRLAGTEDGGGGIRGLLELLRSSGGSGKAWTVCLMPIMLLLLLLRDEEQESAPPSSTYTLY